MQLAKVLRILKIMKMLKLLRLPRIFSTLRAVVGKAFISMIMLLFGILMVCPAKLSLIRSRISGLLACEKLESV